MAHPQWQPVTGAELGLGGVAGTAVRRELVLAGTPPLREVVVLGAPSVPRSDVVTIRQMLRDPSKSAPRGGPRQRHRGLWWDCGNTLLVAVVLVIGLLAIHGILFPARPGSIARSLWVPEPDPARPVSALSLGPDPTSPLREQVTTAITTTTIADLVSVPPGTDARGGSPTITSNTPPGTGPGIYRDPGSGGGASDPTSSAATGGSPTVVEVASTTDVNTSGKGGANSGPGSALSGDETGSTIVDDETTVPTTPDVETEIDNGSRSGRGSGSGSGSSGSGSSGSGSSGS